MPRANVAAASPTPWSMTLKSQDVLVACCLRVKGTATQAQLAEKLRMSASTVWHSLQRLKQLNFFSTAASNAEIDKYKLYDLLVRGVPMFFAAQRTGIVRGIPTGIYSPVFRERFAGLGVGTGVVQVWPYGRGKEVGEGLVPIYPSLPSACTADESLYEVMAAAGIMRVGKAREREAAAVWLGKKLGVDVESIDRMTIKSEEEGVP